MYPTQALELALHRRRVCPPQQLWLQPRAQRRAVPCTPSRTNIAAVTRRATAPTTPPTSVLCSDNARTAIPTLSLSKRLSHARWGLRMQTRRLAELTQEVERREARAAAYRADVQRLSAELEDADPAAMAALHDVSGGAR